MANTLATRKQSQAIRDRMQLIRNDLPYDADIARARMQELTDWKYHMRKRPWPILAAVAVASYLLVPAKREERLVVHNNSHETSADKPVAKRGLMGGILGALMTLAVKQGTSIATRHLSDAFFAAPQRSPRSAPQSTTSHSYNEK